jgi:hypothetical protein
MRLQREREDPTLLRWPGNEVAASLRRTADGDVCNACAPNLQNRQMLVTNV